MILKFIERQKRLYRFGTFVDIVKWDPLELVYITNPKVANTTIKTVLSECSGILTESERGKIQVNPQAVHEVLRSKASVNVPISSLASLEGYTFFSMVRDPKTRFLSFWKDKICGDGWQKADKDSIFQLYGFRKEDSPLVTLKKCMHYKDNKSELHFRSQIEILKPGTTFLPDFVFRYEKMSELWEWLQSYCSRYSVSISERPHLNITKSFPTSLECSEFNSLIQKRYKKDFELFKYLGDWRL